MALLAEKARLIAEAYVAEELNQDAPVTDTLSERLVAAELYHTRDAANMREGMSQFVAHNVICLTFEDNSRLVRFTMHNTPPVASDWTVVHPASC